jgi:SulP family sulfate permease
LTVALLCLIGWLLRLSALVRLISDGILVGFKAGAGLTIMLTQLPALFGLAGGGHNVVERVATLAGQLGETNLPVLAFGVTVTVLMLLGERVLPGRPVGLPVVVVSIIVASVFGLAAAGFPVTGEIPAGLPSFNWPELRLRDVEGIFPLAAGYLLLSYIESVSAARSLAENTPTPSIPARSFSASARRTLPPGSGRDIPSPAACRNRR